MGFIAGDKYPPNESGPISGRSKWVVIAAIVVSCVAILLMEVAGDVIRGSTFDKNSAQLFFGVRPEVAIDGLIGLIGICLLTAIIVGAMRASRSGETSDKNDKKTDPSLRSG